MAALLLLVAGLVYCGWSPRLLPYIEHSAVMFEFVKLIWSPLSICVYMLLVQSGSTYESSW